MSKKWKNILTTKNDVEMLFETFFALGHFISALLLILEPPFGVLGPKIQIWTLDFWPLLWKLYSEYFLGQPLDSNRYVRSSVTARPETESWPFCCLLKACLWNLWVHKTCFVLAQVPRNKDWKRNIIKAINLVIFCSVFPFIKPNWRVKLPPKIFLQWNWI